MTQTLAWFGHTRVIPTCAPGCSFPIYTYHSPMPSAEASVRHNRKRQRRLSEAEAKTDFPPQANLKRQRLQRHPRHRTPSSFWDNLSRQWLTRRALREFDRRTICLAAPIPPQRTGEENINLAKLKRFARLGGPSLDDIRGVSLI